MPDVDAIDEHIETAISEPAQFSADGETAVSRSLKDLLDARDRIAARQATRSRRSGWRGVTFARGQTQGGGRS